MDAMIQTREAAILRAIELELGALDDVLVVRNSVGLAHHVDERTGSKWSVPYGLGKGSPDLVCLVAPHGRALGLEVKKPGERASLDQHRCHQAWRRMGVTVAVVTSVEEARAALEHVRGLDRELLGQDEEVC